MDTRQGSHCSLTLTSAFGTFCIAEGSGMHVSGVIALVILGLVVGLFGRPYLEDHHSVQLFWEMMEYLANTIVFILAGEIVYSIGFSEVRGKPFPLLLPVVF